MIFFRLKLSSNEITTLEFGAFNHLINIQKVFLLFDDDDDDDDYGEDDDDDDNDGSNNDNCIQVDLLDNPLVCDCHLAWILDYRHQSLSSL